MTWMELDREIGGMVSVAIVADSLATWLARSLPGTAEWPGIHWMKLEYDMKLMELWIQNVQGWEEMRASHTDLMSVHKSMEYEGWLALVEV